MAAVGATAAGLAAAGAATGGPTAGGLAAAGLAAAWGTTAVHLVRESGSLKVCKKLAWTILMSPSPGLLLYPAKWLCAPGQHSCSL